MPGREWKIKKLKQTAAKGPTIDKDRASGPKTIKPRVSDKGGDGEKQSPEVAPKATVTTVDTNGLLDARIVPALGSADEKPAAVELDKLFRSTAGDVPNNVPSDASCKCALPSGDAWNPPWRPKEDLHLGDGLIFVGAKSFDIPGLDAASLEASSEDAKLMIGYLVDYFCSQPGLDRTAEEIVRRFSALQHAYTTHVPSFDRFKIDAKAAADATSDAMWGCTACTLYNEMTAKKCKLCKTLRFPRKKKSKLKPGTKIKFHKRTVYKDENGLGVEYARIQSYSMINDAYTLQTLDGKALGVSDNNQEMTWWEVIEE
jgi:hypothetical protein